MFINVPVAPNLLQRSIHVYNVFQWHVAFWSVAVGALFAAPLKPGDQCLQCGLQHPQHASQLFRVAFDEHMTWKWKTAWCFGV